MSLTHAELQELLAAYALDAVDADEAALLDDHLRDCATCRSDLASYRAAATQLAHGVDADLVPPLLWDRVAAALDARPPAFDMGRVVPLPRRVRVGRRIAAIAAAAVFVVAFTAVVIHQQNQLDDMHDALNRDALHSAALAAFDAPNSRTATMMSSDGQVQARAVVLADGSGYLLSQQLPVLDQTRTYQLWAIVDGRPISVSVLGTDPAVVAFHVDQRATALAVSNEAAGGAVQPSATPILSGSIA
jgi:hypothetical protein